jgi:hypothetical protein
MDSTDSHPPATRRRTWIAGLTMAGLAAVAAVISYTDGLYLVHLAGAHGWVALLYPLLPDGLIVISAESLYDAAHTGTGRPRWATTGILLGAALTLAMNVAAGAAHSRLDALIDGVVPVVFFVALEILIGLIRRGRGGVSLSPAPATCGHRQILSLDDAISQAAPVLSKRQIAAAFEVSRARVDKVLPPAPNVAGAAGSPTAVPVTLNGSASG